MSPETPTVMWIAEDSPAYQEGHTTGCAPDPATGRTLPRGLRGNVTPAREACGKEWSFIRFEVPGYSQPRFQAFYVPTRALSTSPPTPSWGKAPSTGGAWTRQAGEHPTLGFPLDDPKWTAPVLLPGGEPVERLASDVIRTASGHELWLDPFYLGDVDPLGRKDYSASEASVPLRRRFLAGLSTAETAAPLSAVPTADVLAKQPVGRVYALTLRPEWLDEGRFSPEWFDPVAQTLDHACAKEPKPGEPCGRYELDYSAFGAWLPLAETDVVARWNGKVLAVQVIEPWSDHIAVSPAWDGSGKPEAPR